MDYKYINFDSQIAIEQFFIRLNDYLGVPLFDEWYKEKGLKLYGYFLKDITRPGHALMVFGKTILRDSIKPNPHSATNIFAQLKTYGSSASYKGLCDIRGNVLYDNICNDISILYFLEEENELFLKVTKSGKSGIIKYDGRIVNSILPISFDKVFYANEYTFGFVHAGKVGFSSLEGKVVIEPRFVDEEIYNKFENGKALVRLNDTNVFGDCYINHYGECIEQIIEFEDDNSPFNGGTGYRGNSDMLDAYDGDRSALWNTD